MSIRKHKGVTLIETIVTLVILSILFSIGTIGYSFFNKVTTEMKNEEIIYEIVDLITYAKIYCKNKNTTGVIFFNNNEIEFLVNRKKVVMIENLGDLYLINLDDNPIAGELILNINKNGIATPMSIILVNNSGERYEITIAVGSNRVRCKGGI